jgi:DNA-binding Lrp family transcriptional regulator
MHVPDMSNYEALLRYELADVPAIAEIQTSIVISEVKAKREFALPE